MNHLPAAAPMVVPPALRDLVLHVAPDLARYTATATPNT